MRQFRQFFNDNTGLLLVACSQAFFAVMNTAVKELNSLSPPVSTLELVLVRMFITYFCGIVYMLWTKVEDPWIGPKGVRLLLALRGFFGFFGLFGIYYSLQYLSLSDATVLTFLAPLCTGIAGSLVLNERFTWREATAGVFSFFGVVLIARPAFLFGHFHAVTPSPTPTLEDYLRARAVDVTPEQRLVAVGVALVGVLGSTGAYTSIRAIGTRAHPIHMMSSFSFQCVVVSSIAMVATKTPFVIPTRLLWLSLLALIGIFGFLAQILLTMGLQRETAGRGTMAVYTLIIFSSILDRIFFHSIPSLLSVLGTLIIMASAIWVGVSPSR
ncbi:drug/metabolite transporter superfamily [Mycena floridula]|nr:drug/metabolite transporter superfamily [Mycena floridula]